MDEKGIRKDYTETVRGTRKDAERRLQEKLLENDQGLLVDVKRTLNEYFDTWLENVSKVRNSPRTAYGDEQIYKRNFRGTLGHKRPDRLEPWEIQAVYSGMLRSGRSPQTVKHAHAVLRKFLNHLVRWRVIPSNPALLAETPKVQRKERSFLSIEQSKRFVEECRKNPMGLVFEFALMTGMHPEEYLAVKWEDIDLDRKTATVRRALVRLKREWTFREPKTGRSRRQIVLPDSLVKRLAVHKEEYEAKRTKAANLWAGHDLLFCGHFGEPLHHVNLTYRHFRPILEAAGIERIRLYDLRHSHASLLLAAEEHPKVVAERLGHSTIVLTLDTYSHVLPTMQKRATEKLESMIFG
jgi:integrase